jgi:phosphoribosylformylglycinamidine (FGAM) synthase PurS component
MWANQKEIFDGNTKNLLVVADTSGSMTCYGAIPFCTSVGLAIYIAERNKGFFQNHFITFSDEPTVQEIKGKTITEKVKNMREINVSNTDIDEVFDLVLKTSVENKLSQEDLPEIIFIISDMEFDRGVHSKEGTNFKGWKKAFEEEGYHLLECCGNNRRSTCY